MPHSNGRIYTSANGNNPDYGADLTGDVAAVLGVNSDDTATLCSHTNINKWATFKPVKSASIKPLTKRMRHDAAYGLQILNRDTNGGVTLMAACDGIYQRSAGFTNYLDDLVYYDRIPLVSAGVVSPYAYRIDDFAFPLKNGIGYNHRAEARASYKDNSSNWHGIEIRYSGRGENNQGIGIENPGGNEELVNDWTNFSEASFDSLTDSNITTVHESILIQDLLSGYYHNYSGLTTSSGWNIGIIFTDGSNEGTFIWVGGINWSNTDFTNILSSHNVQGSCLSVMMFFTTKAVKMSGQDYDYYTNTQFVSGNPNWIAIPKSYAEIYLKSAVDGRVFSAILAGSGAIPPGLTIITWYFDLSACIRNINWSNMGLDAHDGKGYYVRLVLGESNTTINPYEGSAIKVYQDEYNGGEIHFSAASGTLAYNGSSQYANQLHDSSLMGQTMYLNFVGKGTDGNEGVIWSEEVTLDYKSEYIEQ